MGSESYMHLYAKSVLAGWLREWASRADGGGFLPDEFAAWAPFRYWRVNRGGPHYGVWEEWPVFGNTGLAEVWDETAWPWITRGVPLPKGSWDEDYVETDDDRACDKLLNERPPTYAECLKMGMPPSFIFDVAIQHKGMLIIGLEVVHRNDISDVKLHRLEAARRAGVSVFRVPAKWILAQVGMPAQLVCERVI